MRRQNNEERPFRLRNFYEEMFSDFLSQIDELGDEDADILWLVFEDCLKNNKPDLCSKLLRMFKPKERRNIILKKILQAKLCMERGNIEDAIRYLNEANQINAKDDPESLRLQGYTLHLLGLIYAEKGKTRHAIEKLRKAVRIYDRVIRQSRRRDIISLRNKGLVLRDLGEILVESGHYHEALRALSSSVHIYNEILRFAKSRDLNILNDKATSLRLLGEALSEMGDEEGAIENIASAIHIHEKILKERKDPDPLSWYYRGLAYQSLGEIFIRQGDFANALGAFSEAVFSFKMSIKSSSGINPNAWHSLGLVFQSLGEIAMSRNRESAIRFMMLAVIAYRRALEEQSYRNGATLFNMSLALSDIGTLLYGLGNRKSEEALCLALKYMRRALNMSPEALRAYISKTIDELQEYISAIGFSCV